MKRFSFLTSFILVLVIAVRQNEPRPFFGSFPWHQLNVGSIQTIYGHAQGSRNGWHPEHPERSNPISKLDLFNLENEDFDVQKETEDFFNNMEQNPYLMNINPEFHDQQNQEEEASKTIKESSTAVTPKPLESSEKLSKEDEEFLLKHFDQGMNLAQEFAYLLYEDGFNQRQQLDKE